MNARLLSVLSVFGVIGFCYAQEPTIADLGAMSIPNRQAAVEVKNTAEFKIARDRLPGVIEFVKPYPSYFKESNYFTEEKAGAVRIVIADTIEQASWGAPGVAPETVSYIFLNNNWQNRLRTDELVTILESFVKTSRAKEEGQIVPGQYVDMPTYLSDKISLALDILKILGISQEQAISVMSSIMADQETMPQSTRNQVVRLLEATGHLLTPMSERQQLTYQGRFNTTDQAGAPQTYDVEITFRTEQHNTTQENMVEITVKDAVSAEEFTNIMNDMVKKLGVTAQPKPLF